MGLAIREKEILLWYKSLTTLERVALHCWLSEGDIRLFAWLRPHSEKLQKMLIFSTIYSPEQLLAFDELGKRG